MKSRKKPKPKSKKSKPIKGRVARRKGRPPEGTEDWKPVFLAAIRSGQHVSAATNQAKVDVTMPYREREHNADFRAAWEKAERIGTKLLEGEASRRAFHGTKKPVYQGGKHVGDIQEYFDTLLIFLLKARRPKRYRETFKHQHGGDPDSTTPISFLNLTDAELDAKLAELERESRRIAGGAYSR